MPLYRVMDKKLDVGTIVFGGEQVTYKVAEVTRTEHDVQGRSKSGWKHRLVAATPEEAMVFQVLDC